MFTHVISFLPPAPEVLTNTQTWLMPTSRQASGEHIDFQRFRGFLRAGNVNYKGKINAATLQQQATARNCASSEAARPCAA
jgi:hypothetical protein